MNVTRLALPVLCAASLLISHAHASSGSPELREKFGLLADKILKNTKNQPVTIGVFSHTGLPDSNSGVGLEEILREEIERRLKNGVRADARFEVKGDYAFARSRKKEHGGQRVIKIKVRIIEREFSEDLLEIPLQVALQGTRTIAEVIQATALLDPAGTPKARNDQLHRARVEPKVHVDPGKDTRVRSDRTSTFEVEVVVGPNAKARPTKARAVRVERGLAVVDIERDEIYELRLRNGSDRMVAASVSVDGLDMFHFSKDRRSDGTPQFTHLIIPRGETAEVIGWHYQREGSPNYHAFLVTEHGKGAVTKAGVKARGKVGVIHVQFAFAQVLPEGVNARGGNETGFGPGRDIVQGAVRIEVEPPHDFVSLRYTR